MSTDQGVTPGRLADILLDFAQAPGRYPVRLGEPNELYRELDTVAQWALGRVPEPLQSQAPALAAAAVLFVQRACFGPDSTHYQVLGFTAKSHTAEALRTRYRALIRLTHPDMGVAGLPSNAAVLVNRAYEVLTDPELRRSYDEQLQRRAPRATDGPRSHSPVRRVDHALSLGEKFRHWMARYPNFLRWTWVGGGVSTLLTVLMLWAMQDDSPSRMLVVARAPAPQITDAAPLQQVSLTEPVVKEIHAPKVEPLPPPSPTLMSTAASTSAPQKTSAVAPMPDTLHPVKTPPPPAPASTPVMAAPQAPSSPPPALEPRAIATVPAAIPTVQQQPAAQAAAQPAVEKAWSVDAQGAKQYLGTVVSALAKPVDARQVNAFMEDMRIKGSLLHPALRLLRDHPQVQWEQTGWHQTDSPGAVSLQTALVARAKQPSEASSKTVRYRLQAEFLGTREGTVLARLDLKEED